MNKDDFSEHTRYTVTLRAVHGSLRPANIYIYKLHPDFCIARHTDSAGQLIKIAYNDIHKLVKRIDVADNDRFTIPDSLLDEKTWKNRTSMDRYSSSPHAGK